MTLAGFVCAMKTAIANPATVYRRTFTLFSLSPASAPTCGVKFRQYRADHGGRIAPRSHLEEAPCTTLPTKSTGGI